MIRIVRSGTHIVIVDQGRIGFAHYGVPQSGAMDTHSAMLGNILVGNDPKAALLEMYMPGHRLQFTQATTIALTGASAHIQIDSCDISTNQRYQVASGSILTIGAFEKGARVYLAVSGGLKSKELLNSRSPLSSFLPHTLRTGDSIDFEPGHYLINSNARIAPLHIAPKQKIKASGGPEWHLLSDEKQSIFLNSTFEISGDSNRMGYRLNGPKMDQAFSEILSSAVLPGTVQLLPNGLPIILMKDCQTTGGYNRILQIIPESINQLAQRRPGSDVQFELVC